jgi:hypothetical protein
MFFKYTKKNNLMREVSHSLNYKEKDTFGESVLKKMTEKRTSIKIGWLPLKTSNEWGK